MAMSAGSIGQNSTRNVSAPRCSRAPNSFAAVVNDQRPTDAPDSAILHIGIVLALPLLLAQPSPEFVTQAHLRWRQHSQAVLSTFLI